MNIKSLALLCFVLLIMKINLAQSQEIKGEPSSVFLVLYTIDSTTQQIDTLLKVDKQYSFGRLLREEVSDLTAKKTTYKEYGYGGKYLLDIREKDETGRTLSTTFYYYDDDNQLLKLIKKNADYKVVRREEYFYENGILVRTLDYGFKAENLSEISHEYNSDGLITKKTFTRDGKISSTMTYAYSDLNKTVKETVDNKTYTYLSSTNTHYYNQYGDIVKSIMKNLTEFNEYKYDENGNWIEKRTWYSNKPKTVEITTREIDY